MFDAIIKNQDFKPGHIEKRSKIVLCLITYTYWSLSCSLIQLLDYPLVFLDLTKDGIETTDSDDENSESDPKSKSSSEISSYRQFAQEIMVCISFTVNVYIA